MKQGLLEQMNADISSPCSQTLVIDQHSPNLCYITKFQQGRLIPKHIKSLEGTER